MVCREFFSFNRYESRYPSCDGRFWNVILETTAKIMGVSEKEIMTKIMENKALLKKTKVNLIKIYGLDKKIAYAGENIGLCLLARRASCTIL